MVILEEENLSSIFGHDTVFARFMNTLWSIICVGVLWVTFCLPIITIGASSAAAYYTMVHTVRGGKGNVTSNFIKGIKNNWKITFPISIVFFFIALLLAFDAIYLFNYGTEFSQTLSYITYGFIAIFIGIQGYIYPCCAQFDEKRFELFKLAFFMTFSHILNTIGVIILFVGALFAIYMAPWSVLIIPGLFCYLKSILISPVVKKFVLDDDEDEIEEEEEDTYVKPAGSMRDIATRRTASIEIENDEIENNEDNKDRIIEVDRDK